MKLYSWNVNGIRAVINKGAFQDFMTKHQPDVLFLQETKAKPDQVTLELPGYNIFWYSAEKAGYSGVAVFSKIKPLQVVNGFSKDIIEAHQVSGDTYGDPNREGRVIAAEFEAFWAVGVYTPNAKEDLSRVALRHDHWDPAFLAYCQGLESGAFGSSSKGVIFCGDLNVAHTEDDLANPKPNKGKKGFTLEERAGFSAFVAAGFTDTLRMFQKGNGHYTWWSHFANARARNVGWRIDYFLVSEVLKNKVKAAEIHADVMGSDHCPISVTLEV